MRLTWGGGVVKRHVGFPTIDTFASRRPSILIGQMQRLDIRKLSKHVKNHHPLLQKLIKDFVGWPWLDTLDCNNRKAFILYREKLIFLSSKHFYSTVQRIYFIFPVDWSKYRVTMLFKYIV